MATAAETVRPTGPLAGLRASRWFDLLVGAIVVGVAFFVPFFFEEGDNFIQTATLALAYTVMALGLNIIVGFAGLLDLGYVAFFAIGAYVMGWFGSLFFAEINGEKGIHILTAGRAAELPGIHMNFILILVAAVIATTIAGMLIGLPTLRLRGDYIAIVTLAFGEIIGRIAINGDELRIGGQPLTRSEERRVGKECRSRW